VVTPGSTIAVVRGAGGTAGPNNGGSAGANSGGASGLVTLSAADTSSWPVGTLRGDVRIAFAGGAIAHSETFSVQVDQPVTRP
jgi:hypothetical protein